MSVDFGTEIVRRRRELKLTQEDLAKLSKLSVNFISRIERTKNQNISIQKLDLIATALNTTTPEIINKVYNYKPKNSIDNTTDYIQELNFKLNKLPIKKNKKISQAFLTILEELN